MEVIFGALIELFGEVVLGFVVDLIGSAFSSLFSGIGSRFVAKARPRAHSPYAADTPDAAPAATAGLPPALRFLLYLLLSTVLGLLSLAVFPHSFAQALDTRLAVLVGTPLACGLLMAGLGEWRRKRGQRSRPLESFTQGCAFALPMTLIRFFWAH